MRGIAPPKVPPELGAAPNRLLVAGSAGLTMGVILNEFLMDDSVGVVLIISAGESSCSYLSFTGVMFIA
jgi:hypothetical protein